MRMAWLTKDQLETMGFAGIGRNARLSDKASFYNCPKIRLGDDVRIDDFCVLSAGEGGINLGDHIHIAVYSSLIGAGNISLEDFCNISSRVSIYSSNDDYSGEAMTNPTVPQEFTKVCHSDVRLGRHVIVGSGSVIFPGVTLEDGVAVGALSLVKENCWTFGIYAGIPARCIGKRHRGLLEMEKMFLASERLANQ